MPSMQLPALPSCGHQGGTVVQLFPPGSRLEMHSSVQQGSPAPPQGVQAPSLQVPLGQATPHLPQFIGSASRSTSSSISPSQSPSRRSQSESSLAGIRPWSSLQSAPPQI